jgi:uncharacterized protein
VHPNAQLFHAFHDAQGRFYAGGDDDELRGVLGDDVTWHVPGRSAIAGHHRGIDDVIAYFARRRALTGATFRVEVRDVLANDERVIALSGGIAERGQNRYRWETAGVFRVADGRICECWLLPFDQYLFDEIWS